MPALFAVGAALVVLAAAKIVEIQLAQNSRDKFAEDRLLILRGEGRLITYRLAGRAQRLRSFQESLEDSSRVVTPSAGQLKQSLREFLNSDPGFNAVMLVSPDGSVIASAESHSSHSGKSATPTPAPDAAELSLVLSSQQTWVSPVKNFGGEAGVVFSCMVDTGGNGPLVLLARSPARWLLANLFTSSPDNPGREFIDHVTGTVLVAGPDMIWEEWRLKADPELFQRSSPGSHFRTQPGGDIVLQHTVDVLRSDSYPSSVDDLASVSPLRWSVVQRIPGEMLSNLGKLSVSGIWLVAAVALTVIVPASFFAARGWERRKRDEDNLRASENSLRLATSAAKLGIWMLEYPGPTLRWSPIVRRIHGVPDDFEPEVKAALAFYPPDQRKLVADAVAACEKDGRPMDLEVEFRNARGRLLWVKIMSEREILPDGKIRIHGTFQDITESREAALAISENRERLSMAFLGGGMALADRNPKTGLLLIDRSWCQKLGYDPGSVEHAGFWNSLIVDDDHPAIEEGLRRYIDGDADFFEAEYRIRSKDGGNFWVIERSRAVELDSEGIPSRLVGVVFDITRQKETESRLAEALEHEKDLFRKAQAAARAKRDFLAVMSHEIRTPLNGILGFAEILGRKPLATDDREAVETIRQSGESLLQIINDVLDYSRMDAGRLKLEPVVFHLPDAVSFVVGLLTPAAAAKQIGLVWDIAPGVPEIVKIDPGRLKQILVNLAGNAVKFTQQGSVTIRITREPDSTPQNLRLRFSVADTGIGIPGDQLTHIFEPFVQADASISRSHGGTGLGLAITRSLVRLMGGDLQVASEPGRGSTFSFTIPVESAPADTVPDKQEQPRWETAERPAARSLDIVVAEDDRVNAKLTRLLLTKLGYSPRMASDGAQAVESVISRPPDLVLMDVHMPGMDGIEATRRIREWEKSTGLGRRTLIAAFTADVLPEDRAACLDAGMDEFLLKPLQSDKLLGVLERAALARTPADTRPETSNP